ncbi:hypothetical protein IBX73_11975 [candidate division WOR-3 bacterium]|nr:hypothetical protein [candidate division WOR-3 bacterium]
MKKIFALTLAASLLGGLYGMTFGLGAAYDNIAGPEGTDPYLAIRADVVVKPLPVVGFRMGLIAVDLKPDEMGGTAYVFGTGVSTDVLAYIPMAGMVSPYIPLGFWYSGNGSSVLHLKGGLGAEFTFGGFGAYLEGGINFYNISVGDVSDSQNPLYVQGGFKIPVKF